jgi:hypothetical protein
MAPSVLNMLSAQEVSLDSTTSQQSPQYGGVGRNIKLKLNHSSSTATILSKKKTLLH